MDKRPATKHTHKFGTADDDAVHVLLNKLLVGDVHQHRREKFFRALEEASRMYMDTTQKERQAFFRGLLTGYAVALKLV